MQTGTAIQALIVLTVCLIVESFEAAGSASNHLVSLCGGLLLNAAAGMSHAWPEQGTCMTWFCEHCLDCMDCIHLQN